MTAALRLLVFAAALLTAAAPVRAAELLMVERLGCTWCQRWLEEVGPIYPKTDEGRAVPLRRAMIDALPAGVTLAAPVVFTPTFILVADGRERGRITGYADDAMFWGLLGALLKKSAPGAS